MANIFIKAIKNVKRKIESMTQTPSERRHSMVGLGKLWKVKRDFQIQFLKEADLQPHHHFLEIGCGTLRGGIPIIKYLNTGHYTGIEVRSEVLEEGKKELQEAELYRKKPELIIEPNIIKLKFDKKFDYIWAFSVLMHMQEDVLFNCLTFVHDNLSDKGVFYANISNKEKLQGSWQGFPVIHHKLHYYKRLCLKAGLDCSGIGSLKQLGHLTNIEMNDTQEMLKIRKL